MKLVCTVCTYQSLMVRGKHLLPQVIHADGGFFDSSGFHCPNGHLCRIEKTGNKGIRKLPGAASLPRKGSIAHKILDVIRRHEEITYEDLVIVAWKRWPEMFGLRGYEDHTADSNKVQSVLSGKRMKLLLELVPGKRTYRLTSEARRMADAQQRDSDTEQDRKTGGHHPARNRQPDIKRTVRPGGVGRIVGRTLRDELEASERKGSDHGE